MSQFGGVLQKHTAETEPSEVCKYTHLPPGPFNATPAPSLTTSTAPYASPHSFEEDEHPVLELISTRDQHLINSSCQLDDRASPHSLEEGGDTDLELVPTCDQHLIDSNCQLDDLASPQSMEEEVDRALELVSTCDQHLIDSNSQLDDLGSPQSLEEEVDRALELATTCDQHLLDSNCKLDDLASPHSLQEEDPVLELASTCDHASLHSLEEEDAFLDLASTCDQHLIDSNRTTLDDLGKDIASGTNLDVEDVVPLVRKSRDLVALSKKRVRLKQRAEARAAKAARKQERARAKQRRGAGNDLEAFLLRTMERVETNNLQPKQVEILCTPCQRRGSSVDIESFHDLTRKRVDERADLKKHEVACVSEATKQVSEQHLNEFRKKTRARVVEKLWSSLRQVRDGIVSLDELRQAQVPVFARRRIAVVGAGPVGLWFALLLELKYAGKRGHIRQPDAPEVIIIEARPQESHCARTDIRIALSSTTLGMLNQRTGAHLFASGMSVADIESALLRRLEQRAPHQTVQFDRPVDDPVSLARSESFDCILWAGGRRSLDSDLRKSLRCELQVGKTEGVLVFQMLELQGAGDIWQFANVDFTGIARQAASLSALRVMIRPGHTGNSAGWLWIFGIPSDIEFRLSDCSLGTTSPSQNMTDAFDALAKNPDCPNTSQLRCAVEVLQQRIRPTAFVLRLVDASFWSSDHVVCELASTKNCNPSCPLVLLGDAAYGKPFYTGTTLNRHFWDVAALVDHVDWTHDGGVLARTCFDAYERRYQNELVRIEEFGRRSVEPTPPIAYSQRSIAHPQRPRSAPRPSAPFLTRLPAQTSKSPSSIMRPLPLDVAHATL